MKNRDIVKHMVQQAGKSIGVPDPYEIKAIYKMSDDPNVVFAVFVDADGKQWQTGRFKITTNRT